MKFSIDINKIAKILRSVNPSLLLAALTISACGTSLWNPRTQKDWEKISRANKEAVERCLETERRSPNENLTECEAASELFCKAWNFDFDPETELCVDRCYLREKRQTKKPYQTFSGEVICVDANQNFCNLYGDDFDPETGECIERFDT